MNPIKAHFDGKLFVPDEPVDLQPGQQVILHIKSVETDTADQATQEQPSQSVFDWIVAHPVDDPSLPTDLAHQHDHYLYGTPKKKP